MLSVRPSVHPSVYPSSFDVTPLSQLFRLGWTQDLVHVIAVALARASLFFFKSVSALCWTHERLKGTAVIPFCLV